MTTPHPHLDSSLPIVTCSAGRFVRLDAYRLSFPLSTRAYQFRTEGRGRLPFTGEVRVDDYLCWEYHLTHMDTQLSKITRPLPLNPRTLQHGFERTGRTHRLHLTAFGAGTARQNPRNIVLLWLYPLRVSRRQVSHSIGRGAK